MHGKFKIRFVLAGVVLTGIVVLCRTSSGVEPEGSSDVTLASFDEAGDEAGSETAEASKTAFDTSGRHFVGVGSCAASNCHGGAGTHGPVGSEYSIWIQEDEHARAYSVLYNETSKRMTRLMKLDKPAHQAELCLNCHAPQSDPPFDSLQGHGDGHGDGHGEGHGDGHGDVSALPDGVGCEACHGAASDWLGPHVRRNWELKSEEEKAALGFRNTDDLWSRGKMCADCHVGEPGRDVNHDLYAAGHPRLFFELSAFHANMPAHWDRNEDRALAGLAGDRSAFEAKLWSLGQLASAEAAIDLLIHRAENARDDFTLRGEDAEYPAEQTVPVWPEFAETGCYACHHDLDTPRWRQSSERYGSRTPGGYPWGTWLFPLVPTLTSPETVSEDDAGHSNALMRLTREMARPYPNRDSVISTATDLRGLLTASAQKVQSQKLTADQIASWMKNVASRGEDVTRQNWDGATQTWLALTALHQGWQDASGADAGNPAEKSRRINAALEQIRSQLTFPEKHDSPANYSSDPAEEIIVELKTIQERLE